MGPHHLYVPMPYASLHPGFAINPKREGQESSADFQAQDGCFHMQNIIAHVTTGIIPPSFLPHCVEKVQLAGKYVQVEVALLHDATLLWALQEQKANEAGLQRDARASNRHLHTQKT